MYYDNRDDILLLTAQWKGDRFDDGRPRVSDELLARISKVTIEEAHTPLVKNGYRHQFEGRLRTTHAGKKLIGRAVTATMVPTRLDVHMQLLEYGQKVEGRNGFFNQWVVDELQSGDVVVVDMFDKIEAGTFVGGNLSTSIKSKTGSGGAVIWGGIRDLEQIVNIEGFQCFYRGSDPAGIADVMMTGINTPTRIGNAVCIPGDVVLGTVGGVIFIPPHLAELVAMAGEKTQVKDLFGFERLKSGTYTAPQIDTLVWTKDIMDDFQHWFKTSPLAQPFQHLDWSEEIKESEKAEPGVFLGLA